MNVLAVIIFLVFSGSVMAVSPMCGYESGSYCQPSGTSNVYPNGCMMPNAQFPTSGLATCGVPEPASQCSQHGGTCNTGSCVMPYDAANNLSCNESSAFANYIPVCSATLMCASSGQCISPGSGAVQNITQCGYQSTTTGTVYKSGASEETLNNLLNNQMYQNEILGSSDFKLNDISTSSGQMMSTLDSMFNSFFAPYDVNGNPDSRYDPATIVNNGKDAEAAANTEDKNAATDALSVDIGFDLQSYLPLPQSGTCEPLPSQTFHVPYLGYKVMPFDPCLKLEPLRQILYYALFIISVIGSYKIMTRGIR